LPLGHGQYVGTMEGELNPACGDTDNTFALITGLTLTSRHVCLVREAVIH
jgi:hypothetical protein